MPSTYEPIETKTLVSAQSSVTFSVIPSTYTDLVLISSARSTYSADPNDGLRIILNSDSSSAYSWTTLNGDGSSASSSRAPNVNVGELSALSTSASSNTSFSTSISHFQNYSNTTTNKTVITRYGQASYLVQAQVCLWRNTSAINNIVLSSARASTFVAGSTFTLYGIKAA